MSCVQFQNQFGIHIFDSFIEMDWYGLKIGSP